MTKIDFQNFEIEKSLRLFSRFFFPEHRNFQWKNDFRDFFRKYFFIENFDVPEKNEKKSQTFFDFKILKIDFRHENLIFFFQIFFLERFAHTLSFPHI